VGRDGFRRRAAGALPSAFAVAFGSGLPIVEAEATITLIPNAPSLRVNPVVVSDEPRPKKRGTLPCIAPQEQGETPWLSRPPDGEPWSAVTICFATDAAATRAEIGWGRRAVAAMAPQAAEATTPDKPPRATGTLEKIGTSDSAAAAARGDRSPSEPIAEYPWFLGAALVPDRPPAEIRVKPPIDDGAVGDIPNRQLAQFQLPPIEPGARDRPPRPIVQSLTYQYSYGSESSIVYRRDADLNKSVRDNVLLVTPQINGLVVYRPTNWFAATLEMIAEVEIPEKAPETVALPNGQIQGELKTTSQLLVDQGYLTFRAPVPPYFEFNVGRRNYEDERHWLYDTSLDIGSLSFRQGPLRIEAFAGRQVWKNANFAPNQSEVKDRINTTLVYLDYRGIEDIRLAAYTIRRDDLTRNLGMPRLTGVRALGRPTDNFNFWTELAYLGGTDPAGKRYSGRGLDVGATYRFTGAPLNPNVTLGYAYGSGDDDPNDKKNHTFQQSGLESNESRFAGISKFKYYGEVLDPQLSNIKIYTLGVGAYPAPNISVDLVYHRYRLSKFADEVPGSPITALMSQVDPPSATMGTALDVILGFRQLFGIRRLGVDLRMGWFFPGKAFRRNDGTDERPIIRNADHGFTVVAKFWW
jgi:alginate production protein